MSETTLREFITRHGITADVEWADANPNMMDMPGGSTHWLVTLQRNGQTLPVPFSQGPAIDREPDAETVLDCLASDAATLEEARGGDWLDWAVAMGYDSEGATELRKARDTFAAIERQTNALREFLPSEEAFETLLYETERL